MPSETTAPTLDALLGALGWKANLVGVLSTLVGWLLSSQGAALIGIVGVLGGMAMQFYFKRREDRRRDRQDLRAQEEHELHMQKGELP